MTHLHEMTESELAQTLEAANNAYRAGSPVMSDAQYDQMLQTLAEINPDHALLQRVEPEPDFGLGKVRHEAQPMLSTDKAYTHAELCRWLDRLESAGESVGTMNPVMVDITPKFDGVAARYNKGVLATRGDGYTGNDVTHIVRKGLVMPTIAQGTGEIVLDQAYFDTHLKESFRFPRNVVAGALSADTLDPLVEKALEDGAVAFVSFGEAPYRSFSTTYLREHGVEAVREQLLAETGFPTDGLVLEAILPDIRNYLGSTSNHHRWMLAFKQVGETCESVVNDVRWQVGRTGRVTPVVEIEPVHLSGATISNVTAHHAGMLRDKGIGPGARLRIVRSGEVIPKIVEVPGPVENVALPESCPCCASALEQHNDFLVCPNLTCSDRVKARLEHFFSVIGTIDLFGPVACQRLVEYGVTGLSDIFGLSEGDYEQMGFGPGQARNMASEIDAARQRAVDDFRVLASLGIEHLGRGDSKKILRHVPLAEVGKMSADEIESIDGFGQHTAGAIAGALGDHAIDLAFLRTHFERIVETPRANESVSDSVLSGKRIVFTGKMLQGSRDQMIANAEQMGAVCQSSVNGKTDVLVAGENTGASKLEKASKHGTAIMSEAEYQAWIGASQEPDSAL